MNESVITEPDALAADALVNAEEEPVGQKPTLSTLITTPADCLYHFILTITKGEKAIKSGVLTFNLNTGFNAPENVTPALAFTYVKPKGTWTITDSASVHMLSFDASYTGAANMPVLTDVSLDVTYTDNTRETIPFTISGRTTTNCMTTNPCCESCTGRAATPVTFQSCDDYQAVTSAVIVAPKGRKLVVNLNLPAVCNNRDINVGVYVTETTSGTEVPFAHKIIRRPASAGGTGTCMDNRDCDCVEFLIDDPVAPADAAACPLKRTFNVRVQAHYLDAATTPHCACSCPAPL